MTIIVADAAARVMACDTQGTGEDREITYHCRTKLVRCKDGSIAGAAGTDAACLNFLRWAKAGRRGRCGNVSDAIGLVLMADGRILIFNGNSIGEEVASKFAAIGSGASIALG